MDEPGGTRCGASVAVTMGSCVVVTPLLESSVANVGYLAKGSPSCDASKETLLPVLSGSE